MKNRLHLCLLFSLGISSLVLCGCRSTPGDYSTATDLARLEQLRDNLRIQAERLEREVKFTRGETRRLEVEITKALAEKRKLAAEMIPLGQVLAQFKQRATTRQGEINAAKKTLATKDKELQKVKAGMAGRVKETNALQARDRVITKDLPQLRTKIAQWEAKGLPEYQALKKREAALVKRYGELSATLGTKLKKLDAIVKQAEAEKRALFPPPPAPKKPAPKKPAPKKPVPKKK